MLADSHLHFFRPGFAESLPETCSGTAPDEVTLYEAFRQQWDIQAVLAVGFEGLDFYKGNNAYLATLAATRPWIYPLAFVRPAELNVDLLENLAAQKFAGLSMYLSEDDARKLADVKDEAWAWLAGHKALVSVNTRGSAWLAWRPILEKHPHLRLLVSHMGLPGKRAQVPSATVAQNTLSPVLSLAAWEQVHVKLSGFYAVSDPYHDFPHPQALPFMDKLLETFGPRRLLWGSDFAPALEYVSFPQTFAVLDHWSRVTEQDRHAIKVGNLLALLADAGIGR